MRRRPRTLLAVVALLVARAALAAAADAPKLSAHLEPDPVGQDDYATLTIAASSSAFGGVSLDATFDLDNLELAGGPFRSTSQSWVNGVTSSTVQLVWRLRPLGLGRARVREIAVRIEGESVRLPDAEIDVVAEAPRRASPPRSPADPFGSLFGQDPLGAFDRRRGNLPRGEPKLRAQATVQPGTVWVGEQLVWRLLVDTQTDISRIEPRELPDFRGFWSHDITPERTPPPEWIEAEGEKFARVPVLARALFPLQAGELTLPRVELAVLAQVVDVDRFLPLVSDRPFTLRTQPVRVVARPLPAAPPGFSGVVGRLEVSASADRATLETGQAVSFTVTATSDGNLQAIEPPPFALPDGVRSFPPTRESEEKLRGGRLETTVRWRYVLLADRTGDYSLPPIELTAFDPESATYRAARSAAVELSVRPASAARTAEPAPTPVGGDEPAVAPRAIASVARPAAAIAAAVALLALAGWAVRRQRRSGRPAAALHVALDAAARESSPRTAAASLEEAWRGFLAERWGIPRSLPTAQWAMKLGDRARAPELGAELELLFEELHLLAFAPELADVEAHRADVLARSRRLLRRLR